MKKAGCQPHWRRFSFEGLPVCDNYTLLNDRFANLYSKYYNLHLKKIMEKSNCLIPCSFMEYKVKLSSIFQVIKNLDNFFLCRL